MLLGATAIALGLGMLQAVQYFARPLGLLVLGFTVAATLAPIVSWLSQWMPRKLAVILIYLLLLLIIAGLGWWFVPGLIQEGQALLNNLPVQLEQGREWLINLLPIERGDIREMIATRTDLLGQGLLTLPLTLVTSATDILIELIGVLFFSLYGLMTAPSIQRFLLSLLPKSRHERVRDVLGKIVSSVGGYLRGVVITAVLVAIVYYVGLVLLGVEFAGVLSIVGGAFEIIPIIGPLIAGVIVTGVALLQSPTLGLYVLILMLIVQQLEGNVITPVVMHRQTNVNELFVLLAIIAGNAVGGVFGILVAIPLVAALSVIVQEVVAPMVRRWTGMKAEEEAEERAKREAEAAIETTT